MTMGSEVEFKAPDDPYCKHMSHYECVKCHKMVCARCGMELALSTEQWKTVGYWCEGCLKGDP